MLTASLSLIGKTGRYAALPGLLLLVFLAQQQWPDIHRYGALWSDHPRWWQFFTCNFLSGNWIHLLFNMLSMTVLHWQFGPRVRLSIIKKEKGVSVDICAFYC
jgi:membrane associated rhomboid family serine protease